MNKPYCKKETEIWTLDEYDRFIKELKTDPMYYNAFQLLYLGGLKIEELLALTVEVIANSIEKSNQRYGKGSKDKNNKDENNKDENNKDRIKTIIIPEDSIYDLTEYINNFNDIEKTARIFPITQEDLSGKLEKISETANLKKTTLSGLCESAFINVKIKNINCYMSTESLKNEFWVKDETSVLNKKISKFEYKKLTSPKTIRKLKLLGGKVTITRYPDGRVKELISVFHTKKERGIKTVERCHYIFSNINGNNEGDK